MFCPNCASPNESSQRFCRMCGLKLDVIAADLAEQRPSGEFAKLLAKKRRFELAGVASLSIAGVIGFTILFTRIISYKLLYFGDELLFKAAFFALISFAVASIFFFNYPKVVMKVDKRNPRLPSERDENGQTDRQDTNKLLADPPFQPASVTEHSTELLKDRRGTKRL